MSTFNLNTSKYFPNNNNNKFITFRGVDTNARSEAEISNINCPDTMMVSRNSI